MKKILDEETEVAPVEGELRWNKKRYVHKGNTFKEQVLQQFTKGEWVDIPVVGTKTYLNKDGSAETSKGWFFF